MTVFKDTKFDATQTARLGEDPGRPGDDGQALELQRRILTDLFDPNKKRALYDLTIYVGDNNLTFYGMSRDALRQLSVELERLSCIEY